jgi:hypothetical protein
MTKTKKSANKKAATITDKNGKVRAAHNARLIDRGQSATGGSWSIAQAAAWCGIGSAALRRMAKNGQVPCLKIGRRIVIPRQGFQDWFNNRGTPNAV